MNAFFDFLWLLVQAAFVAAVLILWVYTLIILFAVLSVI